MKHRLKKFKDLLRMAIQQYNQNLVPFEGEGGIKAEVIADTRLNRAGPRVTTMVLRYPRFIHSQFMTHRVFSRNSQSSRAISIDKSIEQVRKDPAMPISWGENKKGMVAGKDIKEEKAAEILWRHAAHTAATRAETLKTAGLHKQIVNRVLEPYLFITTIVTATDWDNFFKLRLADDVQPEMQELARCMKAAMSYSVPVKVLGGDCHMPFVKPMDCLKAAFHSLFGRTIRPMNISAARCARVSYLNHDGSKKSLLEEELFADRLYNAGHLSPFEHQAMFYNGVSDMFKSNLENVIQYRGLRKK